MIARFLSLILLVAAASLSGCVSYYYAPTKQTVLNFKEKGDIALHGAVDGNDGSQSTLGYAFTDHIAVNSNFMLFEKQEGTKYKFNDYMWENELIWFHTREEVRGHTIYAVNLGYGFGEIGRNAEQYGLNFSRQFIQPSIGYMGRGFEAAFSLRAVRINYNVRQLVEWNSQDPRSFQEAWGLPNHDSPYFFMEPAVTIGYGFKAFRLRIQQSWAANMSPEPFNHVPTGFSLSLNINVNGPRLFGRPRTE